MSESCEQLGQEPCDWCGSKHSLRLLPYCVRPPRKDADSWIPACGVSARHAAVLAAVYYPDDKILMVRSYRGLRGGWRSFAISSSTVVNYTATEILK